MDNIVEVIFTLIVGFFWLFGSTWFKKKEEEPSEPTSSRRNEWPQSDSASDDEETRRREIREAIRRKIEERRQYGGSEPVTVFETEPVYQEEFVESPVVADASEEPAEEAFSWNAEGNPYMQEMEQRVREIEATKQKAEALRNKVEQMVSDNGDTDSDKHSGQEPALSIGSVQYALKNPKNVRAAFVYGEILGKPVGLRNSSEIGLGV